MTMLSHDYFEAALGERFEMEVGEAVVPVELVEVGALPESGREGGSFRLEFLGPPDPAWQQGTFLFRRDGREEPIFVTAIARDQSGTRYEAVFY